MSTATDRNGAPMPVPTDGPSMHDLVAVDLDARKQFGLRRYGTPLQAFNGRNALQDAYEEVLDLAVYLRQFIEERQHEQAHVDENDMEEVARQVIDAKKRRLLLHLKQDHGADTGVANDLYHNNALIQAHLDAHRLDDPDHGYQPWGVV